MSLKMFHAYVFLECEISIIVGQKECYKWIFFIYFFEKGSSLYVLRSIIPDLHVAIFPPLYLFFQNWCPDFFLKNHFLKKQPHKCQGAGLKPKIITLLTWDKTEVNGICLLMMFEFSALPIISSMCKTICQVTKFTRKFPCVRRTKS